MIQRGDTLLLAGESALLSLLYREKRVEDSTSRFVENGNSLLSFRKKIFVHNMTDFAAEVKLKIYDATIEVYK